MPAQIRAVIHNVIGSSKRLSMEHILHLERITIQGLQHGRANTVSVRQQLLARVPPTTCCFPAGYR
jgi:hypothetical protein